MGVSDPDSDPLTVTYYGRPFASGNFAQIAQHSNVTGTSDTASWSGLGQGQQFEWYVTLERRDPDHDRSDLDLPHHAQH